MEDWPSSRKLLPCGTMWFHIGSLVETCTEEQEDNK
jgi:hypothetical protein